MDQDKLWQYRLEQLEETVCKHEGMINKNTEKINEHDKLIDRVGLKLDQIASNVAEVKADVKLLAAKRDEEITEEAGRPKKLLWEVLKYVALTVVGAVIALVIKQ